MKNINFKNIPFQIILGLLFVTQWVQAESGLGFEDDVQDVPAAPIDNWVAPAVFITILLVFLYQKKLKFKNH